MGPILRVYAVRQYASRGCHGTQPDKTMPANRNLHKLHDSFVVPEGNEFSDEFYTRDLPPGAEEIKKILDHINSYFHEDYAVSFTKHVAEFLDRMYFRSRWVGFDELPKRNNPPLPIIYISNHSGMAFPWDAIIFSSGLLKRAGYQLKDAARPLIYKLLAETDYLNPYMMQNFWRKVGCIDATLDNFEAIMHSSLADVLVYPEGVGGISKGFDKRYKLQHFSLSFTRMALKYKVDVVPVATINGEYINPYSYRIDQINKAIQKIVKLPFLPVGPLLGLLPASPWAFYFGMPARLTYVMGEPIKIYEMTDKDPAKISKGELRHITNHVQQKMQAHIDASEAEYGRDPYQWDQLIETWKSNLDKLLYTLPSGWPLLFAEHDRQYEEHKEVTLDYSNMGFVQALARNPDKAAYLVPFAGWLPLLRKAKLFS